jgi:hypothetical protein
MRTTVTLAKSQFGNPQPTLEIHFTSCINHRVKASEVYEMAAKVELASGKEQWAVVVDRNNCLIHLELLTGSESEADTGMRVLRSVCK